MSKLDSRRMPVALAAVAALLIAAFAAAPQANAATMYTCHQKTGKLRVVAPAAKCKRSEDKLAWSTTRHSVRRIAHGAEATPSTITTCTGKNGVLHLVRYRPLQER
jgi:hypothetical protein